MNILLLLFSVVHNPLEYGGIPNDGLDDSQAFAKITENLKDGDEIFIPQGTWNIDCRDICPMHFRVDNIRVHGTGIGRTKLEIISKSNDVDHPFRGSLFFLGHISTTEFHSGYTLENFTVFDKNTEPFTYGNAAVWSMYSSDITIRECQFIDCKGSSLYLTGGGPNNSLAKNLRIEKCRFETSEPDGFSNAASLTYGGWDGVFITENLSRGRFCRGGYEGGQAENVHISFNIFHLWKFDNPAYEGGAAIGNGAWKNAVIIGNKINKEDGYCIGLNSDASNIPAGSTVIIADNILRAPKGSGIIIQPSNNGEQRNIAIRGNNFQCASYFLDVWGKIPNGALEFSNNICDLNRTDGISEIVSFSSMGTPGLSFTSTDQSVRIFENTIVNGHERPDIAIARICNLLGWTNGLDSRLHIFNNKIGNHDSQSASGDIGTNSPARDWSYYSQPFSLSPIVDLPSISKVSNEETVPIYGLLETDKITCVTDKALEGGLQVIAQPKLFKVKMDQQGTKKDMWLCAWRVVNHTTQRIDPKPNTYRFIVERK